MYLCLCAIYLFLFILYMLIVYINTFFFAFQCNCCIYPFNLTFSHSIDSIHIYIHVYVFFIKNQNQNQNKICNHIICTFQILAANHHNRTRRTPRLQASPYRGHVSVPYSTHTAPGGSMCATPAQALPCRQKLPGRRRKHKPSELLCHRI